jgi:hypothetical protein
MRKNIITLGLLCLVLGITSCTANKEPKSETKQETKQEGATTVDINPENALSVEKIDALRAEVEALKVAPIEMTTENLRAKTKQKWKKLHFYAENGVVRKVKTYPHEASSKRTEEFYIFEGNLVLVVIEDNGDGPKGKAKSDIDKMYYFSQGKLIQELNKEKQSEYTIRDSDAEELIAEFNEYIELYKKMKP